MRSKIGLISISILALATVIAIGSGLQAQTSQEHKGDLSGVWFRFDGTAFEIKEEPSMLPSALSLIHI